MKAILDPHGRTIKFGRRYRPERPRARVRAHDFLHLGTPTPPSTFSYVDDADRASLSAIFLNDQLGDCVIAGGYHVVGVETGNAGKLFVPNPDQIIADYSAIGGYVPGSPSTDQGCNEQDALDYWQQTGFANGTKLAGSLLVDASRVDEIKACVYLFGNVIFGVALPDAWISPFPGGNGFLWDVAGDPDYANGHCFVGVGYTTTGVVIDTWGMLGTITWEAVAKYAIPSVGGEIHSALTPDQIIAAVGKAPNGMAWNDLVAAFDQLGGKVAPMPTPPTPGPPTVPPTGVTLEQAQAWATSKLKHGHARGPLSYAEARDRVVAGLDENWPK